VLGRDRIRTYDGAVALITGGASGIGRAIGEELARRGATVVLADLQGELAAKVAAGIPRAKAAALDVRDMDAVERLVADVFREHGRVDYVFNNAGTGVMGEAHLYTAADWDLTIDVNLRGVVHVIRAAYPRLIAQRFGHLVNTASMAGLIGTPLLSAYSATKHAVVGLSKAMRVEAGRFGVRVSALCPGAIKTPLLTGGAFGRSVYEMSEERRLEWWSRLRPQDVDVFAKDALAAVASNEGIIILPKFNRPLVRMLRLLPWLEEIVGKKTLEASFSEFPETRSPAE
jgi:NAD(P)-dependent dehydrogenase (short-subunit alcohol dehydrogenase family)